MRDIYTEMTIQHFPYDPLTQLHSRGRLLSRMVSTLSLTLLPLIDLVDERSRMMRKSLVIVAFGIAFGSYGQTATSYYDQGVEKHLSRDHLGAIADYDMAIQLDHRV